MHIHSITKSLEMLYIRLLIQRQQELIQGLIGAYRSSISGGGQQVNNRYSYLNSVYLEVIRNASSMHYTRGSLNNNTPSAFSRPFLGRCINYSKVKQYTIGSQLFNVNVVFILLPRVNVQLAGAYPSLDLLYYKDVKQSSYYNRAIPYPYSPNLVVAYSVLNNIEFVLVYSF